LEVGVLDMIHQPGDKVILCIRHANLYKTELEIPSHLNNAKRTTRSVQIFKIKFNGTVVQQNYNVRKGQQYPVEYCGPN
jgi:hypothetical protein